MDVTLPNGQVINGVPDGTTKAQLAQKLQANGMDVPKEWMTPTLNSEAAQSQPYNGSMSLYDRALQAVGGGARALGLAGRTITNAATSLPLAAADFGIGARNLIMGENNPSASALWNQSLNDAGVPQPQGMIEKGGDIIGQMMIGSKLPVPMAGDELGGAGGVPLSSIQANYVPALSSRVMALQNANKQGLVVPPSTTNPTITNRLLESYGGKIGTAQDARAINMDVARTAAQEAVGLHPEQPVTAESLSAIRQEASPAYEALRGAGTMQADDVYKNSLANIASKYEGAAKSFPGLKNDEIGKIVETMNQPEFDAGSAVDATRVLREKADSAFASGDKSLGSAYRTISDSLEGLMERNLSGRIQPAAPDANSIQQQLAALTKKAQSLPEDLPLDDPRYLAIEKQFNALKAAANVEPKQSEVSLLDQQKLSDQAKTTLENFRNARKMIAKTYSVQNAMTAPDVVSAAKLGDQLTKGKPLSGPLLDIAKFGQSFRKVATPLEDSGAVRNTDVFLGAGAAGMSHNPAFLAYPFTRMGVRQFLLSPTGQQLAVPSQPSDMSTAAASTAQAITKMMSLW